MSPQQLPAAESGRRVALDEGPSDPSDVLTALNDVDCRRILDAAETEALTTREIATACELPLSTTYRKVDLLTDAGLLEESVRLRTSGKHPSEYRRSFDDIVVRLSDTGDVAVDIVSESESESPPMAMS